MKIRTRKSFIIIFLISFFSSCHTNTTNNALNDYKINQYRNKLNLSDLDNTEKKFFQSILQNWPNKNQTFLDLSAFVNSNIFVKKYNTFLQKKKMVIKKSKKTLKKKLVIK